jgi:hypothetical protein
MTTTPAIRRANVRLLLCLILFALALALAVFFWMRAKVRANGGRVDPAYSMHSMQRALGRRLGLAAQTSLGLQPMS